MSTPKIGASAVLTVQNPPLDGRFLRRRAFALRRMLDADRVVRLLGRLGEVRRALVGDERQALMARVSIVGALNAS